MLHAISSFEVTDAVKRHHAKCGTLAYYYINRGLWHFSATLSGNLLKLIASNFAAALQSRTELSALSEATIAEESGSRTASINGAAGPRRHQRAATTTHDADGGRAALGTKCGLLMFVWRVSGC